MYRLTLVRSRELGLGSQRSAPPSPPSSPLAMVLILTCEAGRQWARGRRTLPRTLGPEGQRGRRNRRNGTAEKEPRGRTRIGSPCILSLLCLLRDEGSQADGRPAHKRRCSWR